MHRFIRLMRWCRTAPTSRIERIRIMADYTVSRRHTILIAVEARQWLQASQDMTHNKRSQIDTL